MFILLLGHRTEEGLVQLRQLLWAQFTERFFHPPGVAPQLPDIDPQHTVRERVQMAVGALEHFQRAAGISLLDLVISHPDLQHTLVEFTS